MDYIVTCPECNFENECWTIQAAAIVLSAPSNIVWFLFQLTGALKVCCERCAHEWNAKYTQLHSNRPTIMASP
jgi:hypothetical protein